MPSLVWRIGADVSAAEKAFNRLNKKMQKIGRQAQAAGKTMTAGLTLPITAIGTAAMKAANDIDKANKTIATGTGATGKQLQSLQKDWKSLAGQVSQGFGDSAQVIADYNTRLGLTGKSLTSLSKQALDAGRMLDEDVNQIVAESSKAMQDWSVDTDDMSDTMDKLFKASQSTGIGMGKLSTELYKYGSPMRQMGFSMDEAIALMSSFEKEGVNTELVLGSLRIALGKMASAGVTDASAALDQIIEKIKTAGSTGEANAIALKNFGSRAGPDMAAAIREGRFEVDDLIKSLDNASGSIESTNDSTKTLGERWSETKNQISVALEPIGSTMLTMANDYIPGLQKKIQGLSDKFASMSTDSRDQIVKLGAALAVGGPLLIAVSATITAVGNLSSLFLTLTGPIGLVIGALSLMSAGLSYVQKHFDKTKERGEAFKESMKNLAEDSDWNFFATASMPGFKEQNEKNFGESSDSSLDDEALDDNSTALSALGKQDEELQKQTAQLETKNEELRKEAEALREQLEEGISIKTTGTATTTSTSGSRETTSLSSDGNLAQTLSSSLGISQEEALSRITKSHAMGPETATAIARSQAAQASMNEAKNIAASATYSGNDTDNEEEAGDDFISKLLDAFDLNIGETNDLNLSFLAGLDDSFASALSTLQTILQAISFTKSLFGFAEGGIIPEPVVGVGLNSGAGYTFAEQGPERVISNKDLNKQASSGGNVVHMPITVNATVSNDADITMLGKKLGRIANLQLRGG